jgi:hypothetical protein
VDRIKRDILTLYRADIAKHAAGYEMKVLSIFDEIPAQLMKHEKKVKTKYAGQTHVPYVLHTRDLKEEDGIVFLPLYMTPLL